MKTAAVAIAAMLALAAPAVAQVKLEGSGDRRKQLDAMHLTPFDSANWGLLSEWVGAPISADTTKDKVVLIVTWSGWYKPTHTGLRKAQSLHGKFADKGLVVVGVHNPRDFASAAAVATQYGVTFPYAADANGKFREALKVDQDPDFYIIDRAGQMRYADVDADGVDAAITQLLAESAEQAGGVIAANAASKAAAEREAMRFRDVQGRVKPGDAPTVDFELPDTEAYKAVRWPKLAKFNVEGLSEIDQLVDKINKEGPAVTFPEESWTPSAPNTKGKLVIVYIIDPMRRDMINIMRDMNRVQDIYTRDVVVIGTIGRYLNPEQQGQEEDPREAADLQKRIESIVASIKRNREVNHPIVVGQVTSEAFTNGKIPIFKPIAEEEAGTFILSSDGAMRYLGHPSTDNYHAMVKSLINLDPGVQARRKAEDAAAKGKR